MRAALDTEGLSVDERGKGILDSGHCTNSIPSESVRGKACLHGAALRAVRPGSPVFHLRGAVALSCTCLWPRQNTGPGWPELQIFFFFFLREALDLEFYVTFPKFLIMATH